jgi:hypothetical protein
VKRVRQRAAPCGPPEEVAACRVASPQAVAEEVRRAVRPVAAAVQAEQPAEAAEPVARQEAAGVRGARQAVAAVLASLPEAAEARAWLREAAARRVASAASLARSDLRPAAPAPR